MLFFNENDEGGGGDDVELPVCCNGDVGSCYRGGSIYEYTYDALGRLQASEVIVNGLTVTTTITYDKAGNRTGYKVEGGSSTETDSGAGASAPTTRRFVVVPHQWVYSDFHWLGISSRAES